MNILRFLALGDKKLSPFNITHRFTHLFWLGDLNYRVELPTWVRRLHLGSIGDRGNPIDSILTPSLSIGDTGSQESAVDRKSEKHVNIQNLAKAAAPLRDSVQLLPCSLYLSLQFPSACVCLALGLLWLLLVTVSPASQPANSS